MNITEIIREVKRDYDKVVDTTLVRLGQEYDRERKKFKIDKKKPYPKFYTIKTAAKNNWIIVIRKQPSVDLYKSPHESLTYTAVTYYYDDDGLRLLRWTDPYLQMYSSHFIQRYKQRLKLAVDTPVDVIKHYLLNNSETNTKCLLKNGIFYIVGFANEGALLGNLQDEYWILWRTFVSRDLIHKQQSRQGPGHKKDQSYDR